MDNLKKCVTIQKDLIARLLRFPYINEANYEQEALSELYFSLERFEMLMKKPFVPKESIHDYLLEHEDEGIDEKIQDPDLMLERYSEDQHEALLRKRN